MAIVDPRGRILNQSEVPTGRASEAQATVTAMVHYVESARDRWPSIAGIGVGIAAQVDPRTGMIAGADDNIPGWTAIDLRARLGSAAWLPVAIDNDANVAALGEGWTGAAAGLRDFILITLGTGVGGGIVCGSMLVTGARGGAAEIGHLPVRRDGPPCYCGGSGCLEQLIGGALLVSRANARGITASRASELFEQAKSEARVRAFLAEAAEDLAFAVISLVNLFQPQAVVIGGGLLRFARALWLPTVARIVAQRALANNRSVQILPALLGNNAGIVGAASLIHRAAR